MSAPTFLSIGSAGEPWLAAWCSERGLALVRARSSAEVVERAQAHAPVLIAAELSLARIAELAGLARLRELPATRAVPLVFVCASNELDTCRTYSAPLGALAYLTAPLTASQLEGALAAVSGPWEKTATPVASPAPAPPAAPTGPELAAEIEHRLKELGSLDSFGRLGLQRTATEAEIRAAAQGLDRRFSENAVTGLPPLSRRSAETLRRAIELAAELLLDPVRRAEYLARLEGRPRPQPAPEPESSLDSLFREAEVATDHVHEAEAGRTQEPAAPSNDSPVGRPSRARSTVPAEGRETAGLTGAGRLTPRTGGPAHGGSPPATPEGRLSGSGGRNVGPTTAETHRRRSNSDEAAGARVQELVPSQATPFGGSGRPPERAAPATANEGLAIEFEFEALQEAAGAAAPAAAAPSAVPSSPAVAAAPASAALAPEPATLEVPTFDEVDDIFGDDAAPAPSAWAAPRAVTETDTGAAAFWRGDAQPGTKPQVAQAPASSATPSRAAEPHPPAAPPPTPEEAAGFSLARLAAAAIQQAHDEESRPAEPLAEDDAEAGPARTRRSPKEALTPGPEDWFLEARFFICIGDFERARGLLEAAIAAEPGQRKYQYWLELGRAKSLLAAGRTEDARAQLDRTKRLAAPGQAEVEILISELEGKKKKGIGRLL